MRLGPAFQCAAFSQCIGDGPSVCTDICRVSVAPFGTVGHSDCRDSAQVCADDGDMFIGTCRDP